MNNEEEFRDCATCVHKDVDWDEEPCKYCDDTENYYEKEKK